MKDYDSTLVHNPEHMLAYANRGMVYIDVSQYDTAYRKKYINLALQDFNKAISLDPEYADNYYNLGWTYYVAGDLPKACELWKKADELGSINISFISDNKQLVLISISNITGQEMYSQEMMSDTGENAVKIAVNNLESGIYLLKLNYAGESTYSKLIIQ